MNVDVSTEIAIDRPRLQVAAFSSNPDNVPGWYSNVSSVEWNTAPPLCVGSQVAFVTHFPGRRLGFLVRGKPQGPRAPEVAAREGAR